MQQLKRFNMGAPGESDCPVFDGMYEYFAVSFGFSHHHGHHGAMAIIYICLGYPVGAMGESSGAELKGGRRPCLQRCQTRPSMPRGSSNT